MMNNRIDKDNNNNIDTSDSNLPDDNEVRLSSPNQFYIPPLKLNLQFTFTAFLSFFNHLDYFSEHNRTIRRHRVFSL